MDVITGEIIRGYLETVCAESSTTMENTAISTAFNSSHDYSNGIFYYDGSEVHLLAREFSQPVHIYAALTSVEAMLEFFKHNLYDGDLVLVMDPYYGGSHLFDWTIMKPVFYKNKPVFFPSIRGHIMDVGGPVPGGHNFDAREIWQEGFRIAPIKIYERGILRRDVWDLIMANNRLWHTPSDVKAMIGGCTVGEKRIIELFDRYGPEKVLEGANYILDYSERRLRREISKWPDGDYQGESILDHDCAGTEDIPIKVKISVRGDEIQVDFTGTHPQTPGFVNSPPGNSASWVYIQFTAVMPDIPVNSGFFRPIKIHLPKGSVVNPNPPAPVAWCTLAIGNDIGQAVMKALEKIVPEKTGCAALDWVGIKTFGTDKYNEYYNETDFHGTAISSGGAYGTDGWGGWSAPHCSLKIPPIEILEVRYPCLYLQAESATDTAAPGRWRGAPAYQVKKVNRQSTEMSIRIQGARHTLAGYVGGKPGAGNYASINYGTPKQMVIRDRLWPHFALEPGAIVFMQKGGAGGWGDPLDRDPDMVLKDVINEYVSIEGAKRDYGVVIDPGSMTVDEHATKLLRGEIRDRERLMDQRGAKISHSGSKGKGSKK